MFISNNNKTKKGKQNDNKQHLNIYNFILMNGSYLNLNKKRSI
jgi:hypothetical protein